MSDQIDWVRRAVIVTAAIAPLARHVASQMGPSSQGMFTAALQPIGPDVAKPTHFISEGAMDRDFADMLASPDALVEGAAALGLVLDDLTAETLLGASDVSEEEALSACARLKLRPHNTKI